MQQSLLQQGLQLMLFGMGTVFIFLVVLIACTTIMSRMVLRFAPAAPPAEEPGQTSPRGVVKQNSDRARLIAVISAAVHQHRAKRGE